MSLLVPIHQFEIRFSQLLNFNAMIKEVASPFVPLATNFNFENEQNTRNTKVNLTFANEFYSILITYDRIVLRYEGNPSALKENNSIIEEPFLNLFNKLKSHKDFGKIINVLFYTIYINPIEKSKESIVEDFSKNNLIKAKTDKIMPGSTDVSVILNKNTGAQQVQISYGPYIGIDDLSARNVVPLYKSIDEFSLLGEMAEVKIVENTSTITFAKYKEMIGISDSLISKLW